MQLDHAIFPLHAIAARALQTRGGKPLHAKALQCITLCMAHIVAPQNHLLRESFFRLTETLVIGERFHRIILLERPSSTRETDL